MLGRYVPHHIAYRHFPPVFSAARSLYPQAAACRKLPLACDRKHRLPVHCQNVIDDMLYRRIRRDRYGKRHYVAGSRFPPARTSPIMPRAESNKNSPVNIAHTPVKYCPRPITKNSPDTHRPAAITSPQRPVRTVTCVQVFAVPPQVCPQHAAAVQRVARKKVKHRKQKVCKHQQEKQNGENVHSRGVCGRH